MVLEEKLKNKIEMLVKAGKPERELLQKLMEENKGVTESELLKEIRKNQKKYGKGKVEIHSLIGSPIFVILLFVALAAGVFYAFAQNTSYSRNECNTENVFIKISGSIEARESAAKALDLVQETSCEYFLYIADNTQQISLGTTIFPPNVRVYGEDYVRLYSNKFDENILAERLVYEACLAERVLQGNECFDKAAEFAQLLK